jgi:hypothetical protein
MTDINNEIFSNADSFHAHLQQIQQEPKADDRITEESHGDKIPEENPVIPDTQGQPESDGLAEDEMVHDAEVESSNNETYKENKFIPKSRFNKEIEKRRELEGQLTKEREDRIRYETQLQMLQQAANSSADQMQSAKNAHSIQPTEEFEPLDPDTHRLYMKKIGELENRLEGINKDTAEKTQQLQYYNIVSAQEQVFERSNPDFKDALSHLQAVETQVAQNILPEGQVNAYVNQKLQSTLMVALNSGKNAAEVMYNMAKSYGYKAKGDSKAATAPQSNLEAINSNMKKTASIQSLNNSVGLGNNSNIFDIKHVLRDPKNPSSGIDGDKFQQLLAKAARG